jgi:amidophosphoribosyltransferase
MCGVIGVFGHPEASNLAYLGLHALQHRGQESAGIVASDGDTLRFIREMGKVHEIFTADAAGAPARTAAIGHVRYSTAGDSSLKNAQPIAVNYAGGSVAIAHNGNLVNFSELRARLEDEGSIFQTTSDTELILHLDRPLARGWRARAPGRRACGGARRLLPGGADPRELIAVRDPMGFRPLSLGRVRDGWVVPPRPAPSS